MQQLDSYQLQTTSNYLGQTYGVSDSEFDSLIFGEASRFLAEDTFENLIGLEIIDFTNYNRVSINLNT